ncbi:MAG: type II toxin-antitoxin system HipA family toxin [Proteobacteria bacterium]|nr:type II toxin-antitoxin system HipA family toxin [Pseudomonadota bacterium]
MNFNMKSATSAYVWIWLPNQTQPVVAGMIEKQNNKFLFTYGKSYRAREDAISLSPFELPLKMGTFEPKGMNTIHSCLRDAAPDAWGRRVILHEYPKLMADELDYMLFSGSNRIGALDFQLSSTEYIPRTTNVSKLADLLNAAEYIDKGLPLPAEVGTALMHGTSVGGARPKCLINDKEKYYIAKFPLSSDIYDLVKAEYIAMKMASLIPLEVSKIHLKTVLGKKILLIERFDRTVTKHGVSRHLLLSGLSLLSLNELEARYASYVDLAEIIRARFAQPKENLKELYQRLIFNVLIGNTDDHARNISAFWDGKYLKLTPAYDILPQLRSGQEASQAMLIEGNQDNLSTLSNILSICEHFLITQDEAKNLINAQIAIIQDNWLKLCEEADLPKVEREKLWRRSILNPFCLYGWNN